MTTLEEYDFLEIAGDFVMMPEEEYREACFWIKDMVSINDGYIAKGVLFLLSDGEIDFNFSMKGVYYYNHQEYMSFLNDNQYKESYLRGMIYLTFDGDRESL